jgi:hypothetical protein
MQGAIRRQGSAVIHPGAGTKGGAMANRPERPDDRNEGPTYSAERARQGRIVLRAPWQRWVFFGGLAAIVILALIYRFL